MPWALAASLTLHGALLAVVTPLLPRPVPPDDPPTEVTVVLEDPPRDAASPTGEPPAIATPRRPVERTDPSTTSQPERELLPPPVSLAVAPLPEPPQQPPEAAEPVAVPVVPDPPPPPPPSPAMPSVAQAQANDQLNPSARFLAERTNSTDRQTQAAVTSLDSPGATRTSQGEASRALADGGQSARQVEARSRQGDPSAADVAQQEAPRLDPGAAARAAVEARAASPDVTPLNPLESVPRVEGAGDRVETDPDTGVLTLAEAFERARTGDAGSVARPMIAGVAENTFGSMHAVFGDRDGRDAERVEAERRAGQIGGDAEERWDRTRAALENFDALVARGEETSLNTIGNDEAAFIHAVHNAIHPQWTAFVAGVAMGSDTSVADLSLQAIADFAVAGDGEVTSVRIRSSSGNIRFDAEIIDLLYRISPVVAPPSELQSVDGTTYVRWHFHRDERLCTSAFADVFGRRVTGATP